MEVMDISPEILANDTIRSELAKGVCPYVLTGGFRAEREASEKTWEMLMARVRAKEEADDKCQAEDI